MTLSKSDNLSILIVDDNPTNLQVLFDVLDAAGYDVLIAEDGLSALDRAEHTLPSIILLDIQMPDIDGFETCARLKKSKLTGAIPIIFMTALSETVDKVRGFDLGAVDYITKPFQHEEVLSRVKTHLTIQHLREELEVKNSELAAINQNLEKLVEEKTRKLIQQEKTAVVGLLLEGVVHNFRNPLTGIIGCNELIRDKVTELSDPYLDRNIQVIADAAMDMKQMMNSLMARTRRDQSEVLESINVNELIQCELDLLAANRQFNINVTKVVQFADEIPEVSGICSSVGQVFHNLINNALDAMWNQEDPVMTISTRHDCDCVFIDVHDNGCGIGADDIDRIFDPFYTSKPAKGDEETGEPAGTGLGLHTCKYLLQPMGGDLRVTSEPGNGSLFSIVLPKISRL